MMNPLVGVPPIYCLSLAGETARQAETTRQWQKYGIENANFFYGFDGRKVDLKNCPGLVTGEYFASLSSGDIACAMGHLSMIRHWLRTSDSETALFIEDDINLENSEHWSFGWNDMVAQLPADWKVIQLALIRAEPITEVRFRARITSDWCVTAYLVKRSYAEWLIAQFFQGDHIHLHTPGDPRAMPIIENLVYFPAEPNVYSFSIFTEKNTYASTFFSGASKVKIHNDNSEKAVTSWWCLNGKSTPISDFFKQMDKPASIPMIGTAVVKNTKWVRRLIASVDYPVDEFFIINNNGKGEIDAELDAIAKEGNPMIGKIRVTHMPANIGVPASWNLMIKAYLRCPYWVIVNDDVAFGAGLLAEMHLETSRDPSLGVIHGYQGDHGIGSWDLFLIRDHVIAEYGLFDENLYPAYNEDADYFLRFIHKPVRRLMNLKAEYYHGEGKKNEYHTHGSQTRKADQAMSLKLDKVNEMNIQYLTRKWGPDWRWCSPTPTPFNDSNGAFPVSTTTYDIMFVRQKYLGF